jgi:hypothetical protein
MRDTPATGEIVGTAVLAALAVSRRNPQVPDQRIADLASGLAVAMVALDPASPFDRETLDARIQREIRRDAVNAGAPYVTPCGMIADGLVAATGLAYGNALMMARSAVCMAGQIGMDLPPDVDAYDFRHDGDGYRIVRDGVVLAMLVEPLRR